MQTFHPDRRSLIAGLATFAFLAPVRAEALPVVAVTKDPSCGCCEAWVAHLREAGFQATVTNGPVNPLKAKLGVPRALASCHTAEVGGYAIEGHVPAAAIKRLLIEKPKAIGLAVPGMPVGSPGMEVEGTEPETYEVVLFGRSDRRAFARYRGSKQV